MQDFTFSALNLNTKEIHLKGQSSVQLVSTSSNLHLVSILDAQNTIHLYTWTGKIIIIVIIHIFSIFRSDQPKPTNLLAYPIPQSSHPPLTLHQSLHMPDSDYSANSQYGLKLYSSLSVMERKSTPFRRGTQN